MSKFPDGFYWGAATSAHQIEGGLVNTWSEWEDANAARLAREAERKFGHLPSWEWVKGGATDPANYRSGQAADFRHRYPEDIKLMKDLGMTMFRFSIDWSRVEPERGRWDEVEIAYYQDLVKQLRAAGIEPLVNLWHWPFPLWAREGWSRRVVADFGAYAAKMAEALSEVTYWSTLNEPEIYGSNSYLQGVWPPQRRNPVKYLSVFFRMMSAHRVGYATIKRVNHQAQVGVVTNNVAFELGSHGLLDRLRYKVAEWSVNHWFLNRVRRELDFIGLNFYFHSRIDGGFDRNANERANDLGWEMRPDSIKQPLLGLRRYGKPIIVTENGVADARDHDRAWWIEETVKAMGQAIEAGVDLRGYLHWSLLDNFEWDKGFWPRFGLVEVDFKTQRRSVRPSAWRYAEIIKANGDL